MQRPRFPSCRASLFPAASLAIFAVLATSRAFAQDARDAGAESSAPLLLTPPPEAAPGATAAKKKARAKRTSVPAESTPADPGGTFVAAPSASASALPEAPMLNLSTRIGIKLVRSALLDESTSADLESGMRGIAFQAPLAQNPIVLRVALDAPCAADDDNCFIARAAPEGVDSVVIGVAEQSGTGIALRLRQLEIVSKKRLSEAKGDAPAERIALKAEAEALLCKMLVPTGCNGELQIDAGEADILYDGRMLPKGAAIPMRATLPVGLAPLSAKLGGRTGSMRLVPVLREKAAGISLAVRTNADGTPSLVTPGELEAIPAPAAAVADLQTTSSGSRWSRPVGFGVAGAGAILLATGLIEGAHAKSLLDSSQAAYNANGGAWQQSDLSNLNSGNSAAHTANVLLLAGGIAAAAGLLLALAF